MVTDDIAEFRATLRDSARLVGLDLGGKTIGIALGTLSVGIATPLRTIRRGRFQEDARDLMRFLEREAIEGIVLGLPLHMDGRPGSRAQATRAFARNLQAFAPPPILLFDERLSSAAAADAMRDSGMSRAQREANIDSHAAQVILQDALGRLAAISGDDRIDA
jgi:putative Holliday junction resolvase